MPETAECLAALVRSPGEVAARRGDPIRCQSGGQGAVRCLLSGDDHAAFIDRLGGALPPKLVDNLFGSFPGESTKACPSLPPRLRYLVLRSWLYPEPPNVSLPAAQRAVPTLPGHPRRRPGHGAALHDGDRRSNALPTFARRRGLLRADFAPLAVRHFDRSSGDVLDQPGVRSASAVNRSPKGPLVSLRSQPVMLIKTRNSSPPLGRIR